jgi:hypothetical protein
MARPLFACTLLGAVCLALAAAPLAGQVGVVLHGRVVDAISRDPLVGARVLAADSSAAVFTDARGQFALLVDAGLPLAVHVEQFGYLDQRFELGEGAPARISVLLLPPAPIELEGIEVVEESAVAAVLGGLRSRRNAYLGPVSAFDRTRLEEYPGATVWDFVRMRAPQAFACGGARSGLCVTGRSRTFQDPYPESPVLICVDGRESWGAEGELSSLGLESVALIEIFSRGRGGIRVYTAGYLAHSARLGRSIATPLWFGC